MYKVFFQVHGAPMINEKFFSSRVEADRWMLENLEIISLGYVVEVLH